MMNHEFWTAFSFICLTMGIGAPLKGPGLQNVVYNSNQVFEPLSMIYSHEEDDKGHGNIVMHNGYMAVIYATDSGEKGGGFQFLDASDLTQTKIIFDKFDEITETIREPHGFGIRRMDDQYHVALQAIEGIHFWDWTDVNNPFLESYLHLPGIQESDYDLGVWWTSWQGNYLYAGGSSNGLYIIKAKDPANPEFIKKLPTTETGGFIVGPVFAVGNLLYISSMNTDNKGFSVLDIGDPENPKLISTLDEVCGYSTFVNGYRFYAIDFRLGVIDASDPTNLKWLGQSEELGGKGGYATYQDGYIHMGSSSNYSKIDVNSNTSFTLVGEGTSGLDSKDEDFGSVMGNIVVAGNDRSPGSAIIPHQLEPDTKGPEVNMVVPYDNATNQPITTRVGLTFTDNVELASVVGNIIVREKGGNPLSGSFTHQVTIVNFSPNQPLKPGTVYEVVVPAEGIEDWVGNKSEVDFQSTFTTEGPVSKSNPLRPNKKIIFTNSNGILKINLNKTITGEIQIINVRGRIKLNRKFTGGMTFNLSPNKFENGIYFTKILLDQQIFLHKITLQ